MNTPPGRSAAVGKGLLAAATAACLLWNVPGWLALTGGIAASLLWGGVAEAGGDRLASHLLRIAIIGLGAGVDLAQVWRYGIQGAGYTLAGITGTLLLGLWLGRLARLHGDVALLLSAGTAICGGSAIAALAATIRAKAEHVATALAVVFLLNAVALLVFPAVGGLLGFSEVDFGLWAALAIHDTSSVVGAAAAVGPEATAVATIVKLTRALWIIPLALAAGWWRGAGGARDQRVAPPFPFFMLGFAGVAALFTCWPALDAWSGPVTAFARRLFSVALLLIGSGFSRAAFRRMGARPLALGIVLWVIVATGTALAVAAGWIALRQS